MLSLRVPRSVSQAKASCAERGRCEVEHSGVGKSVGTLKAVTSSSEQRFGRGQGKQS